MVWSEVIPFCELEPRNRFGTGWHVKVITPNASVLVQIEVIPRTMQWVNKG